MHKESTDPSVSRKRSPHDVDPENMREFKIRGLKNLRDSFLDIRELKEKLLDEYGNFDYIPEVLPDKLIETLNLSEETLNLFNTLFRIGKIGSDFDNPNSNDSLSQIKLFLEPSGNYEDEHYEEHDEDDEDDEVDEEGREDEEEEEDDEVDDEEGEVDYEEGEVDEKQDDHLEQLSVENVRDANSAMIDRFCDGDEEYVYKFIGIGKIPLELSKLQEVLGNIVTPVENTNFFNPVLLWIGDQTEDGHFNGKYIIDPKLVEAANQEGKLYVDVTKIPIVFVCCVYDFDGGRPAHLFAIILLEGKIYSFGFGYKDSDLKKILEIIPLVMYNPDDIMNTPFFTGRDDPRAYRKVDVLNMFLLEKRHIDNLQAFVVDKNPKVRVKLHKIVSVLNEHREDHTRSSKSGYLPSGSEERDVLLYDEPAPATEEEALAGSKKIIRHNCAKSLAKMVFPDKMYCWGNSLSTTIRKQALTRGVMDELETLENEFYTNLKLFWEKKNDRREKKTQQKAQEDPAAEDAEEEDPAAEDAEEQDSAAEEEDAAAKEEDLLKKQMVEIKKKVIELMEPHRFDWGITVLQTFERLYSNKDTKPEDIVTDVLSFLHDIQQQKQETPHVTMAVGGKRTDVKMAIGGKRKNKTKRKNHKKTTQTTRRQTKSKHRQTKSKLEKLKSSKKTTKKRRT